MSELEAIESATDPQAQAAIEAARGFISEEAPHLARIFGIEGLDIEVGNEWITEVYTDGRVKMKVDPSFFVKEGYEPEWAVYGTLHEVVAHVREALWEPHLNKQVSDFTKQGKAQGIFHNILTDIAGNNAIHARLPRLAQVASDVYRKRQMPDDPTPVDDPLEQQPRYRDQPRHMQFLYKMIRQEMIPDCHTAVATEVDATIARLRDFEGSGQDIIKYSTAVAKPDGTATKAEERFGLWRKYIYPEFEALLEQDRQEAKATAENGEPGESGGDQTSEQANANQQLSGEQESDSSQGHPSQQPGEGQPSDQQGNNPFQASYDDYHQNRHPEPLGEAAHEALHKAAEQLATTKRNTPSPRQRLDQELQAETGHRLHELQSYNGELVKYKDQIEAVRALFFNRVITPQLAIRKRLGKTPLSEGVLLDPNRLSETMVAIKNGVEEPVAFLDYEHRKVSAETVGNTDYYLVIDRSSSMGEDGGKKAEAAAASTLIFLEGLAGIQQDIEEAEAAYGIELDVSIRSSVYGFGSEAEQLKPLDESLKTKERLDCYQAARNPLNEGTADYLALEAIADEPREDNDRRRIVVVLTDGESNDTETASNALRRLRSTPNSYVYAISIGSDEAIELYKPDARRCDDPTLLPETLGKLLEETLA